MRLKSLLWTACVAGVLIPSGVGDAAGTRGGGDPFVFFNGVASMSHSDREKLDRGDVAVRILPAGDAEIGVFAATRLDAPPDALVAWTRAIAALKQGPFVPAIRRFSDPPVPEDLDGLRLDDVDLDDIRKCRPGRCDVKLADDEIEWMRAAMAGGGPAWSEAVQREFRRVLLARLEAYRDSTPDISASLASYPDIDLADAESFFYWSKERYGTVKPVVAVTHVTIVRPEGYGRPAVLVVGKEVFATHYRNASLGMTAVVRDHLRDVNYLVYVNRSHVDVLGGVFGGIRRRLIEGRIRGESAELIARVRDRLEGGDPPP